MANPKKGKLAPKKRNGFEIQRSTERNINRKIPEEAIVYRQTFKNVKILRVINFENLYSLHSK